MFYYDLEIAEDVYADGYNWFAIEDDDNDDYSVFYIGFLSYWDTF